MQITIHSIAFAMEPTIFKAIETKNNAQVE